MNNFLNCMLLSVVILFMYGIRLLCDKPYLAQPAQLSDVIKTLKWTLIGISL